MLLLPHLPVIEWWRFVLMAWSYAGAHESVRVLMNRSLRLICVKIIQIYRLKVARLVLLIKTLVVALVQLAVRIGLNLEIPLIRKSNAISVINFVTTVSACISSDQFRINVILTVSDASIMKYW